MIKKPPVFDKKRKRIFFCLSYYSLFFILGLIFMKGELFFFLNILHIYILHSFMFFEPRKAFLEEFSGKEHVYQGYLFIYKGNLRFYPFYKNSRTDIRCKLFFDETFEKEDGSYLLGIRGDLLFTDEKSFAIKVKKVIEVISEHEIKNHS